MNLNCRFFVITLLAAIAQFTSLDLNSQILLNGSFEDSDLDNVGDYVQLEAGNASLSNWTVDNGTVDLIQDYWQAPSGSFSIDLNGSSPGSISNAFSTIPGEQYLVQFQMSGNPDCGSVIKQLEVSIDGVVAGLFEFDTSLQDISDMTWNIESFVFAATSAVTTITFSSLEMSGNCGPVLDDVICYPLPCPDYDESQEDSPCACSDGLDNDGDGLVDCEDSDCINLGLENSGNYEYETSPCILCTFGGSSFADAIYEYAPNCLNNENIQEEDPTGILQAPDYELVSLGEGGYIILDLIDNVLTNSGNGDPDLHVFEFGSPETCFIWVEPFDLFTINACQASAIPNEGNFYLIGGVDANSSSVDMDITIQGYDFGELKFKRIKIEDDINESFGCNSGYPGADIDGICCLSSVQIGCTDENACNFNPEAELEDQSCEYILEGECDCEGNVFDECGDCGGDGELGCTDEEACNYNMNAACDDGTCTYILDGECDCDGNVFDECGNCGGNGIPGCIDELACNYDINAACDDGTCIYILDGECDCEGNVLDDCGECGGDGVPGCNDEEACNYDVNADCDDGTCIYIPQGECDCEGNVLDECGECGGSGLAGCTDSEACNFDFDATCDDNTCIYIAQGECDCEGNVLDECGICGGDGLAGCIDAQACNYDPDASCDDGTCIYVTEEICDGIDNDCDGLIDEGMDEDNDGVPDCYDQCDGIDDSLIGTVCDDENECTVNDSLNSSCECIGTNICNDCLFFAPNAFTPDGDNLNDRYCISSDCSFLTFKMQVFNKFGEVVFETTDPTECWTGNTNNGEYYSKSDVYAVKISYSVSELADIVELVQSVALIR